MSEEVTPISVETPAEVPNDTPVVETPSAEITPAVQPTEPQLFETPDGRKVDGETLAREWKENFYPEFTRKSQELAELKKASDKSNINNNNPYSDPSYVPQSYDEILQAAEQRTLAKIEAIQREEAERRQSLESEIKGQLEEIRKIDPTINEAKLFKHASEFKFTDLRLAHQNMMAIQNAVKNATQATVNNLQKKADPVSTAQGKATGNLPSPSQFTSAGDYLKAIKDSVK